MEWIIIKEQNINEYINFLDNNVNSGIWHYPKWITFLLNAKKIESGFNFIIKNNNEIIICGTFLIYKNRFLKYGYIPAGFIYKKEYLNEELYDFLIKNLNQYIKKDNITFIQIDSITPFDENFNQIIKNKKNYEINILLPIPQYTNKIDLSKTEEDILKSMKHKGRYNIKYAEKNGIKIRDTFTKDIKNIDEGIEKFYELLTATTSRDGFRPNNIEYYKEFIKNIESARLLFAYDSEDELLAAGIFTYTKHQGLYYYGASSNNKRNLMAPYLLQWHAILIAKEKGCLYYDFMGIKNPNNKKDKLEGVTDFKLKFSENIIKFNPSYKIILNKWKYILYLLLKKLIF